MVTDSVDKQLNSKGNRRGMSLNSQKNIVSALKALKGNNHASKDYSITRIIKTMLDDPAEERWLEPEDKHKQFTWRQAIAKRMLIEAVKGNSRITSELFDRLEGKVTQPIGGDEENPLYVQLLRQLRDDGDNKQAD